MNRTEQKERLKEILVLAEETIKSLLSKNKWLESVFAKIDDLENTITEFGEVDGWDSEELKNSVSNSLFEAELESLYNETESFKSDIEEYMDELSESRREKLEDRYVYLDGVLERFYQSSCQYSETQEVVESIQEAIYELKDML